MTDSFGRSLPDVAFTRVVSRSTISGLELEGTVTASTEASQHADLFSLRCDHNPLKPVQYIFFPFGQRQADLLRFKLAIGTFELTDFERICFIPIGGDLNANCDFHPNLRRQWLPES